MESCSRFELSYPFFPHISISLLPSSSTFKDSCGYCRLLGWAQCNPPILSSMTSIPSAKSPLPSEITYSQVPDAKARASSVGREHYAAPPHLKYIKDISIFWEKTVILLPTPHSRDLD